MSLIYLNPRKQPRLKNHDYSQNGYYFVTVCTQNQAEWFGRIDDGQMRLNEYGRIVDEQWLWLGRQYPYAVLDVYVTMPNHFHGIIGIDVGDGRDRPLRNPMCAVGYDNSVNAGMIDAGNAGAGRDRPLRIIKSLSELIGAFKTTSSKYMHDAGLADFRWQRSFYDHVIRGELSLGRVREYIANNPKQWDLDVENAANRGMDAGAYYENITAE